MTLSEAFDLFRKWEKNKADVSVMVMAESQQMIINLTGKLEVGNDGITIAGAQREFRFTPQPNMTFSFRNRTWAPVR